ncbi:hypothetical protein ACLOJK_040652 [Asimina triloba]
MAAMHNHPPATTHPPIRPDQQPCRAVPTTRRRTGSPLSGIANRRKHIAAVAFSTDGRYPSTDRGRISGKTRSPPPARSPEKIRASHLLIATSDRVVRSSTPMAPMAIAAAD